ncbi:hypothetical protein [Burkholderia contaminans]|uniref:Uncharacterized protein n=1 Tax=Burkholderia contaminans TaxID=488447 RepID=A0A3N8NXF5_9BURK|nr:hypothetical protein [Burkholderia contaminans]RQT04367.1 hypothetical protein DF051_37030 [Burkholderia contaminans]
MSTFVRPTYADLDTIIGSIKAERGDAFNEDLADDTQYLTLMINASVTIEGTVFNLLLEGVAEDDRDTLGFYTSGQGKHDDQDELQKAVLALFGEADGVDDDDIADYMQSESTPATAFWERLCKALYDAGGNVWNAFTDEVYAAANEA